MERHAFLKRASIELGMTYRQVAEALGVSLRTVEKWSLRETSPDHREMPLMAIRLLLRMLDDRKRVLLAGGDRAAAETLDALGAQVDPARLAASMKTFDALQRSMARLAPAPRRKVRAFRTPAAKNAWERSEEVRLARRSLSKAS